MRKSRALLLGATLALVASCTSEKEPETTTTAGLTVAPEANADSYNRDAFGGWTTVDGCDTRARVLTDESLDPVTTNDNCTVTAGRWLSVYDGTETTDPTTLEVDHLVPLAEAWTSGADRWDDERRSDFANDVDALVAVTAAANQAKGNSDPAEWLPPDPAVRCWYVETWMQVKATWGLTVDDVEHRALTEQDC